MAKLVSKHNLSKQNWARLHFGGVIMFCWKPLHTKNMCFGTGFYIELDMKILSIMMNMKQLHILCIWHQMHGGVHISFSSIFWDERKVVSPSAHICQFFATWQAAKISLLLHPLHHWSHLSGAPNSVHMFTKAILTIKNSMESKSSNITNG